MGKLSLRGPQRLGLDCAQDDPSANNSARVDAKDDPEAAAVSGKIAASSFGSPVFALAECNSHTDPALGRWCGGYVHTGDRQSEVSNRPEV
jgi:hypothetical protein